MFAVNGKSAFIGDMTVTGAVSATGDIIAFSSSDASLKDNIAPISDALQKLLQLRGVEFDWNDKSVYSGHDIGVIAQEVERIIPSAVRTQESGFKGVQYDKIIPLIIEAIRVLSEKK